MDEDHRHGSSPTAEARSSARLRFVGGTRSDITKPGSDVLPNRLNGLHQLGVRQRRRVHLKGDPRDATEGFAIAGNLFAHFLRAANQQSAIRASLRIEGRTSQSRPAALLAHIGDRTGITREEGVGCLLRRPCDIAGE